MKDFDEVRALVNAVKNQDRSMHDLAHAGAAALPKRSAVAEKLTQE
jgi:hypothetical protein